MMSWPFTILPTLALAFAAFTAIAISMDRHETDVLPQAPSPRARKGWRHGGFTLLGISLLPCLLQAQSATLAVTAWLGILAWAALTLALLLTYRPQAIRHGAPAVAAAGLALWILGFML